MMSTSSLASSRTASPRTRSTGAVTGARSGGASLDDFDAPVSGVVTFLARCVSRAQAGPRGALELAHELVHTLPCGVHDLALSRAKHER